MSGAVSGDPWSSESSQRQEPNSVGTVGPLPVCDTCKPQIPDGGVSSS